MVSIVLFWINPRDVYVLMATHSALFQKINPSWNSGLNNFIIYKALGKCGRIKYLNLNPTDHNLVKIIIKENKLTIALISYVLIYKQGVVIKWFKIYDIRAKNLAQVSEEL